MKVLSPLDATFIYLETAYSPMAIGGLYLIDAKDAPADFNWQSWRDVIQSRLHGSPVFRQRLVKVPWDLSFPYWIRAPNFDLDEHLPQATLGGEADLSELMSLAANFWGQRLPSDKPLWEMLFVTDLDQVDGLSPGSFAMITKLHHAAVDGKASAEMMAVLMDFSPEIRQLPGTDDRQPESLPGNLKVVSDAWINAGRKALGLPSFLSKTAMAAARLYSNSEIKPLKAPPKILTAPKSLFNQALSSNRTFWGQDYDFQRLRKIRKAVPGCTINDVVLAICAGGLRYYLQEKSVLPKKSLVAMAPISVRSEEGDKQAGNKVSAMLVDLETVVDNPLSRLLKIQANTSRSKIHANAVSVAELSDFMPSETLAAATRVYTRTRIGGRHRPFFNVTITNVPGPPVDLYMAGAKIHAVHGMAPILDGLGLLLVVLSYRQRISIGITSCEQIVPDPEFMADCFAQSLEDLELTTCQEQSEPPVATVDANEVRKESPFASATRALDEALDSLRKHGI